MQDYYIGQCTKYQVQSIFKSTIWVVTRIPLLHSSIGVQRSKLKKYQVARICTKYQEQCTKYLQKYHFYQNGNPHFFIQQSEFDIRH
jgi:hypothetical protein